MTDNNVMKAVILMMMIYLGILMPTDWTPAMTWPVVMPARTLSRSYGR